MDGEKEYNLKLQLDRYIRGELSEAETAELKRRVNDDPVLREAWMEFQISRYVDGELNEEEVAELTRRVNEDPALREAMDEYQALEAQLSAMAEDVPDVDYHKQRKDILAEVDRRRRDRPDH
ncbi:MAG TPA: hypothetical protein ENH84_07260 [Phycisphaerae bacterium]|nr:hypothetical protein [Phycisphaerae bacterium]